MGQHISFLFAGGARHSLAITDFNWHHCAVTARNGDVDPTFYVDGVQQSVTARDGASTINLYDSTAPLYIGAQVDPASGWYYYSGAFVDELSIYNRILVASEIQAIYNAGTAGKCRLLRVSTANAVVVNDFVVGATITDGGYGYTNTPTVKIIGGGGSGAQAVAVVSNGVVIAVNVIDAGYGYTNTPLIVIDATIHRTTHDGHCGDVALELHQPRLGHQLPASVFSWKHLVQPGRGFHCG